MGKPILIADPSGPLRRNLSAMLSVEGYDCLLAGDGAEALRMAMTRRPECVLVDPDVGGIDGTVLCQALRTNPFTAMIPVVFMSTTYSVEALQRSLEAGAMDCLQKPLDSKILLSRLLRFTSERYVTGQGVFLIADGHPISFNTTIQRNAEQICVIDKPDWGEELDQLFAPGTAAELHHAAPDFSVYRRRVVLGAPPPDDPTKLEVYLASGTYRGQKLQTFRKEVDLQLRYKTHSSFFRVATLAEIDGAGVKVSGLHESIKVDDELTLELRTPTGIPPVKAKVAWLKNEPGKPIEGGLRLDLWSDTRWCLELAFHLFCGHLPAVPVEAPAS